MVSSVTNNVPKAQKIVISNEYTGQRVDNFLFTYLKGVPKTRVYRIIRKGEVRINMGRVKPDYRLVSGDLLRIPPLRHEEPKPLIELPWNDKAAHSILDQILYEDESLLIINKPAGIAVHGGSGVSFGVIEALRYIRGTAHPMELIHRLDRDTSGCLMISKRRSALRAIHELLRSGEINKVYWTLVKGDWAGGQSITAALKKNQLSSGERIVRVAKDGQSALTEFRVLQKFQKASLIEAKPRTGRTHQIRVHAASVGNPIAGDPKYGDSQFNIDMKSLGVTRLFLHARQISLKLPGTDKILSVEAPLDKQLQACLTILSESKTNV